MSLQGLISGSECALPANPLSQVLKHAEGDRSLQQDRIAGPSSSRLHHLPGTTAHTANDRDLALAQQFFERGGHNPAGASLSLPPHLPPVEMGRLMEMSRVQSGGLNHAWPEARASEVNPFHGVEEIKTPGAWAAEFSTPSHPIMTGSSQQSMVGAAFQQQTPYGASGMYSPPMMNMYGMNPVGIQSAYAGLDPRYNASLEQTQNKGKGKEVDFDTAFAQAAASLNVVQAGETQSAAPQEDLTSLEARLKDVRLEESTVRDADDGVLASDFKHYWDQLQSSDIPPPVEDLAKWEAEFNQLMTAQREDTDFYNYGDAMQSAWDNGLGDYGDATPVDALKFDEEGLPIFSDYAFGPFASLEPNNKYLGASTSTRSLLGDAKELLERNGSLSEVALLLEAAIQKGELGEGGYETWILLGETRNMDEREEMGMRALAEGVKRATESGAAPAGMLSLAISYTNENYDRAAHTMLLRWLQARFPSLPIAEETLESVKHSSWDSHNRITDIFLQVARSQHSQGTVDPDVQIGLGVMFYTQGDFDRAKDCFESALALRPKDYLLWNRLGSCLSNGNKPEEALGIYREALALRPTYTRAIYNVGVACLNIGAHKEAAEHFLSALALQDSTGGEKSEQLWFTLRRTFFAMDRTDLAEKTKTRPAVETFRSEGFDF